MTHLESFGANFAVRFMEVVKPARVVVYGTPSAQLKDGLAGLDPVYMAPLARKFHHLSKKVAKSFS